MSIETTAAETSTATWTYYRGVASGRAALEEGDCLTEQPSDALGYCRGKRGSVLLAVHVRLEGLVVRRVEAQVDCPWPGDLPAERARLVADGVDAIEYRDLGADADGREIPCFRLLSERALAAASVLQIYAYEEAVDEFAV